MPRSKLNISHVLISDYQNIIRGIHQLDYNSEELMIIISYLDKKDIIIYNNLFKQIENKIESKKFLQESGAYDNDGNLLAPYNLERD